MCLAVPALIIELRDTTAIVTIEGAERRVDVSLIEEPQVGDYVLLHAGFAIEKWDEAAVRELEEIRAMEWEMPPIVRPPGDGA